MFILMKTRKPKLIKLIQIVENVKI